MSLEAGREPQQPKKVTSSLKETARMQYNLNPLIHQVYLKIQNVFESGDIKLPHRKTKTLSKPPCATSGLLISLCASEPLQL